LDPVPDEQLLQRLVTVGGEQAGDPFVERSESDVEVTAAKQQGDGVLWQLPVTGRHEGPLRTVGNLEDLGGHCTRCARDADQQHRQQLQSIHAAISSAWARMAAARSAIPSPRSDDTGWTCSTSNPSSLARSRTACA